MNQLELKESNYNVFLDDDFILVIYGLFAGIWIMIIYMITQLVLVIV